MNALPTMLAVWGCFVAAFVALVIYRGHLTRHEVGQVFLSENEDPNLQIEQASIVARVNRIHPFVQTVGGAAALLTVGIIGVYVATLLPQVHF